MDKKVELEPTKEASDEEEVDTFDQGKDACFRSVPRERYNEVKDLAKTKGVRDVLYLPKMSQVRKRSVCLAANMG